MGHSIQYSQQANKMPCQQQYGNGRFLHSDDQVNTFCSLTIEHKVIGYPASATIRQLYYTLIAVSIIGKSEVLDDKCCIVTGEHNPLKRKGQSTASSPSHCGARFNPFTSVTL